MAQKSFAILAPGITSPPGRQPLWLHLASDSQNFVLESVKAFAHIILVSLYCLVTVGMTISTHFCAGVPVRTELGSPVAAEPDWCCGNGESDCGCCLTTTISLVLTDDHLVSASLSLTNAADELSPVLLPTLEDRASTLLSYACPIESPPGASPPLTILQHRLLI